ncbi:hypothetical protein CBM2634_A10127 [Cupriavidus taiwanensis]|uniref:Uncharacterized protein n=1 Tax=Cupriavidus taiwanensis TaxID=164546 RepID=A0A375ITK0_9BURK|nr:hypothetical protein CBM2634_A10127 [Cupriavidus taiwanensis]
MDVAEGESQEGARLPKAFVPAELGEPRIENVECIPVRSQLLANIIYAVCEGFITAQTFLKNDANEEEALARGGSKLIETGDFMFRLRLCRGFNFYVNTLSDEVVAFAFRTTPQMADPGAERWKKDIR